nr:MAG TPA: hypothetical protein [Caudoviricetes sp.]
MGKIYKYSNIYNKDGELIRRVDANGILKNMSLKEVQDLVDKLGTEKDENGNIKDPVGFNNASYILMQMYSNPKYNEDKRNFIKELNDRLRTNKADVERTLEETREELELSKGDKTSVDSGLETVQTSTERESNNEIKDEKEH